MDNGLTQDVKHCVGSRLRKLRERNGWTLRQAAAKAGVTHGAIGHYETGKRLPSIDDLLRLSRVYKTSLAGFARELDRLESA